MTKPQVLFVYDYKYENLWFDGLWAALNILEEDFTLTKLNLHTADSSGLSTDTHSPDFILGWGAFGSPVDKLLQRLDKKKGLCIGGNAIPPVGANNYDVLFYETKWYREQINFHRHIVHAFGVNSDIYNKPLFPFPIVWDYIGVGSFSSWKRWEKMLDKAGNRLVIGEYQIRNEAESDAIVKTLVKGNVMVSNMLHPFDLANLYHWSRELYLPADVNGGGERAVLEARACGLQVVIEDDNPKLKELLDCPIYDHFYYAKQLKEGILSSI